MPASPSRACRIIWISALLTACSTAPSTPYRPVREGHTSLGYASQMIDDHLYFVEFQGSARTSQRTALAFALFRAAELAGELKMAAFTVEEGPVDRTVLQGDDIFSTAPRHVPTLAAQEAVPAGPMLRVRTPMIWIPLPMPETPEARDARTASKYVILRVRMHPVATGPEHARFFVTDDVLRRLGPRIVRGTPP